ncbi:concanavalin A-like lectin/glucanase domain-containing protein [Alternaria alternata]|nr:concanavalin A-like lectin/glucanase domain-containing protein [Alternaria alternata]
MAILQTLLTVASVASLATGYELKATYDASNFFDDSSFRFYNGWDKFTHGLAFYVSKEEATELGLARIEDGKVRLGVDTNQVLTPKEPGEGYGRKSIRLEGVQTFDNGLFIADFDHLPSGCGMWPALWLLHDDADQEDWYSEFDIIEGVSKNSWNELSIHTVQTPCKMRDSGGTGQTRDDLECSSGYNCGVNGPDGSLGQAFNDRHGGVWAAEVSNGGIKAWFFARGSEPSGLDGDHPDPSRWGKPVMNFVGDGCDIQKTFKKMKIILNITFCGRNAGGDTWAGYSGCAAETHDDSCNHFVAANPDKLKEVFYLINSVRVYQNGAGSDLPKNSLASEIAQTVLNSTTTAKQAVIPVPTTTITTSNNLMALPTTMIHSTNCGSYDPSTSATTPTTLASFYGKRLPAPASETDPEVVLITTIVTTTKIVTLPATRTGGDNYSPYEPSASRTLTSSYTGHLSAMASEAAPMTITITTVITITKVMTLPATLTGGNNYGPYDPSTAAVKPTGTTIGGINYVPFDPSVTSIKLVGTTTGGINYSPYDPLATSAQLGASTATGAVSAKAVHVCG